MPPERHFDHSRLDLSKVVADREALAWLVVGLVIAVYGVLQALPVMASWDASGDPGGGAKFFYYRRLETGTEMAKRHHSPAQMLRCSRVCFRISDLDRKGGLMTADFRRWMVLRSTRTIPLPVEISGDQRTSVRLSRSSCGQ